ncbi:hypothetical protein TNCT_374641 [Trichonephila clavata]|uniref:Uncharacterized protein n=1 Tax=Trichonephila clavata TaxID=2740835 RepID=A0A8X6H0K6_TRICU|nr:hypothetical protein TNCT_374641 [Trichonephila clavata]
MDNNCAVYFMIEQSFNEDITKDMMRFPATNKIFSDNDPSQWDTVNKHCLSETHRNDSSCVRLLFLFISSISERRIA